MASIIGFIKRNWMISSPPVANKSDNALKFGILGAANIAPMALITPAKDHPDVVVQCVAARDRQKAEQYAKKHGIPEVKDSYQDILDDPSIDCIYVPLPNGLHYEWALKSLQAGKHVLLEKPSVSNATEAASLFNCAPLANKQTSPSTNSPLVLVEAFHYRFQPQWHKFLSLVDRDNIATAKAVAFVPKGMIPDGDIRFDLTLAGGAMMDLGTYPMSVLRQVFGCEPKSCEESTLDKFTTPGKENIDFGFRLKFAFPGTDAHPEDRIGEAEGSLQTPLRKMGMPRVIVTHWPVVLTSEDETKDLTEGQEKLRTRTVNMVNFMIGAFYHNIVVQDEYVIREKEDGKLIRKWTEKKSVKGYTWKESGIRGMEDRPSEPYWTSYRHQLEAFVNRVRGREGTGVWIDGEDSVNQMKMIDMAYSKAGLPVRQSREFQS